MPMKTCVICGSQLPIGKTKYCTPDCKRVRDTQAAYQKRIDDGDPTVGVGKGGSTKTGEDNSQYVSGEGRFRRLRKELRLSVRYCEWCGVDLKDATRWEWCVHHKDHIRSHNTRDNLVMLCKRCHQVEHDCESAFNK